jgi:hypothetical protein
MKLSRIIEQAESSQFYDLGRDFTSFTQTMDSMTESVKNRFEQSIAAKLKGKKIRARASRGYKQFEKDYEINVANVSLDDYYDNYVVVVRDAKNKEYFLKPGFKVQVLGEAEAPQPDQQPEPPKQPAQPKPEPPKEQPAATPPPQQPQQQVKEYDIGAGSGGASLVRKYPVESIEKDLQKWLPRLLMRPNSNLKQFIPQDGVARTSGRKTTVSYGVTIPTDELPGLSADQIKQELARASTMESDVSDIENLYTLDKFDVRGGKYVIIVRKVSNY